MVNLDFNLVLKIMACMVVFFLAIRHFFDKYCLERFDYAFLRGGGAKMILCFLAGLLFLGFMMSDQMARATLHAVLLGSAVAGFIGVLVYNIKRTNIPIGLTGTALQFTVLLGAIMVVLGIWLAFVILSLASSAGGNSGDD